ncbi:MAG TPA: hypothetical protein VEI94_14975, partial [Candidatus Bathyarchaeia archaeon]|nr:hypothetical protein [Candidatus Bathyarchaeia archaeon]
MSHAAVVLAGLLAFLDLARTAGATTPDDICPAAQDPCLVTVSQTVTSGSDLDFGDRDLIVKLGKSLDVGPGSMTIRARSVKLESSAKILGAGGTISITATAGDIVLENLSGAPKIDVSDAGGGGDLTLVASGGVAIDGYLYAKGGSDTSGDNDGGSIRVVAQAGDIHFSNGGFAVNAPGDGFGGTVELDAAGDVLFDAPADALTLAGGSQGGGGECSVLAGGAIAVDQTIDASGGGVSDGGSITLQSGGNTTTTAKLDVTGGAICGAGGSVTIGAGGDVSLGGSVVGPGGGSITQNCGEDGASLDVSANGAIAVNAPIVTAGGAGDNAGDGGDVSIAAGTSLTLIGPINTGGGNDSASDAPEAGDAGDVSLSAGAALTVDNDIDAGGGHASDGSSGYGGDVTLAGCTVGIPAGVEVSAEGDLLGSNTLQAGELATVAGRLLAADFNDVRYRDPLAPPDLTLATLLPPTVPILDPTLPACGTCGDGVLSPALGEE